MRSNFRSLTSGCLLFYIKGLEESLRLCGVAITPARNHGRFRAQLLSACRQSVFLLNVLVSQNGRGGRCRGRRGDTGRVSEIGQARKWFTREQFGLEAQPAACSRVKMCSGVYLPFIATPFPLLLYGLVAILVPGFSQEFNNLLLGFSYHTFLGVRASEAGSKKKKKGFLGLQLSPPLSQSGITCRSSILSCWQLIGQPVCTSVACLCIHLYLD